MPDCETDLNTSSCVYKKWNNVVDAMICFNTNQSMRKATAIATATSAMIATIKPPAMAPALLPFVALPSEIVVLSGG